MSSSRRSVYNGTREATLYANPRYVRETQTYPSVPITAFDPKVQARKETQRYTGTLVKGIATMHKSNPVPVTAGIGTNPKITS